jgi:hypothetical protein
MLDTPGKAGSLMNRAVSKTVGKTLNSGHVTTSRLAQAPASQASPEMGGRVKPGKDKSYVTRGTLNAFLVHWSNQWFTLQEAIMVSSIE